jgi:hypothetical protein
LVDLVVVESVFFGNVVVIVEDPLDVVPLD